MSAATRSRSPQDGKGIMLEVDGRIYPVAMRGSQPSPSRIDRQVTDLSSSGRASVPNRGRKRQAAKCKKAIAEEIAVRIWERLPLASRSPADLKTSPEIVRCFNQSHGQLVELAAEARRLLETVCRTHVRGVRDDRVDGKRQHDVEEARIRECMAVTMPTAWLGPELDAATVARQPSVVMEKLTKSLAVSVCNMVESLFLALEQLVDKEIVGLIEWHSESVCKFHFFRRLIVHKFDGQTTTERTATFWRAVEGREVERTEKTTTTASRGHHVHEHIRHEQQLMEATKRPLGSPDLVIPQDVQKIVDAIPEWLSPFVRVAVGECFRERIIRHTEKREKWEDAQVSKQVIERAVTYFDPAVTIGEFVLAGWGQQEQAAETERRVQAKEAISRERKTKVAVFQAALVFSVGSLLLLLSLVLAPKLVLPSLAVCLASLVPLNLAVMHSTRRGDMKATAETFFLTNVSGLALTAVAALTMLAVVEKRFLFVGLAGVLSCFFLPMFRAVIRRLRPRAPLAQKQG